MTEKERVDEKLKIVDAEVVKVKEAYEAAQAKVNECLANFQRLQGASAILNQMKADIDKDEKEIIVKKTSGVGMTYIEGQKGKDGGK